MKVSRVSEMRAMDRTAVEKFGISPELLMENAGHATYFTLRREFGIREKRFLIFCGLGNNGGDGFVLARKIHANGGKVQVVVLGEPSKYQGPAKTNYDILSRLSIDIWELKDLKLVRNAIADFDVVIDAIFGTGLSRDVEGLHREIIELINASHKQILSIDIPSGVHGDTGKVMGVAVKADVTVTFGLPKLGNILSPGYELGGKLFVSHISFPPSLHQSDSLKIAINYPLPLPPLDVEKHKSTFGKVLSIGGVLSDLSASAISTIYFLKNDSDYSNITTAKSLDPLIASKGSEAMIIIPQEETTFGSISKVKKETLLKLVEETDLVFLGPGLTLQEEIQELARELAQKITKPLLIDGNGIMAFCEDLEILRKRKGATILTPHLEEMPCITSKPRGEIDERKVDILHETAIYLNSIIVLKGMQYFIALPDQRIFINLNHSSGLMSACSSDIIIWAIAMMYCQGLPLDEAVRQGVFTHGLAEDLAAWSKGQDGITARDILDHLPLAVKAHWEGLSKEVEERYTGVRPI